MNSNLIDFIDYDEPYRNDFYPKLEIEFENPKPSERFEGNFFEDPFQQNLNPPALDRLDSNIFNSIFQSESQQTSLYYQSSESDYHHHHHNSQISNTFPSELEILTQCIVREKKEDLSTTSDDASTIHNMPEPISSKSKRIMKREKAKERSQQKQKQKMLQEVQKQQKEKPVKAEKEDKSEGGFKLTEEAILSGEIPAKFIPEGFSANMDEKTKKKMIQMIRNRISAQNSRDRKKNLIDSLEAREKELMEENLKLKMRVKQLEAEKVLLVRENQKFKKAFESAACAFEQSSNDIFSDDLAENPFSQNSDPSTGGSPDMSGNSSPVYRRGMRSGGFMKYSLALATIFAVLMFNGINAPMNQQLPAVDLINVPQEPVFQVPAPKYARAERILEEAPKLEIVLSDAKSQSLMIKMEEEYPATQPCGATDLNNYPFISQISNLQQNFNEKYMSKFFSQLKIVDPAVLKNFAQSLNLNIVPEKEVNFPSYLRASRRVLPDYSKTKESNQTQIVPFTGSGQKLPIINSDNFSSIFFPAGFEFQGQEAGSFVKVEDDMGATSSQKKLRIVDSEWLQLFVPKNNISVAKLSEQDGLYIDPALNDASDDNTILEVWCKVFFVRELPSGF